MSTGKWLLAALGVWVAAEPCLASDKWICWTAHQHVRIQCGRPDGSGVFNLIEGLSAPMGMAVDRLNGDMYWAERGADTIGVVGLGTDTTARTLVQLPYNSQLRGMAVAPSIGKVYWVAEASDKIQRASIDGSQVEDVPVPPGYFFDVEVDDAAGMLYWTDRNQILRGDLDGNFATAIVPEAGEPYYLAIDTGAGKLYWTDFLGYEIGRAGLDGSAREVPGPISNLPSRPIGIALDVDAGKVYWTLDTGSIQRANIDGSSIETVLQGVGSTWDVTVVDATSGPAAVPAVSTWGLVVVSLMILITGTITVVRRTGTAHTE